MDIPPRPELFDFHGIPMVHYFTDNWENVQNFQARPDDVIIISYPKAGSVWLSYILDLLHFGHASEEQKAAIPLYARVPHLEIAIHSRLVSIKNPSKQWPRIIHGTDIINRLSASPRLFKSHLPVQLCPKSFWEQNCKIVYIARNARDSVVSYFHHERMTMIHPEPGDWSSYLQRFMDGKMLFGSWYDHVSSWWKKKQSYPNLHYMFFEDLVMDTEREIDKLCRFLGLSPSAEQKQGVLGTVQFEKMKSDGVVNHSLFKAMDMKVSSFIRKGKVGDWKNHFTVAQSEEFDEDYKRKMGDPTLQFHTEV